MCASILMLHSKFSHKIKHCFLKDGCLAIFIKSIVIEFHLAIIFMTI